MKSASVFFLLNMLLAFFSTFADTLSISVTSSNGQLNYYPTELPCSCAKLVQ